MNIGHAGGIHVCEMSAKWSKQKSRSCIINNFIDGHTVVDNACNVTRMPKNGCVEFGVKSQGNFPYFGAPRAF